MPIEYRCVKCGKLLRVADQYAGHQAKCPDCGMQMTIPMSSTAPGAAASAAPGPAAPPPPQATLNPYASPTEGGGAVSPSIDLGDIFSTTWEIFKREALLCIGLTVVAGLVPAALYVVVYLFAVLVMVVTKGSALVALILIPGIVAVVLCALAIQYNLLRSLLKLVRRQPVAIGELFQFTPDVWPFLGVSILVGLLVAIGSAFCIVPGFIIAALFTPAILLVLDRKVPVFDALGQSKDLAMDHLWPLCGILLIAGFGGALVTVCTFNLGAILVAPFVFLMNCVIYLRLTKQPVAV